MDDIHPFYSDLLNVLYDKVRQLEMGGRVEELGIEATARLKNALCAHTSMCYSCDRITTSWPWDSLTPRAA